MTVNPCVRLCADCGMVLSFSFVVDELIVLFLDLVVAGRLDVDVFVSHCMSSKAGCCYLATYACEREKARLRTRKLQY